MSRVPLLKLASHLHGFGHLDAMTELNGNSIPKTLNFLDPWSHVDNPHTKVKGLFLYCTMHHVLSNRQELLSGRLTMGEWRFHPMVEAWLDPCMLEIIISRATGQNTSVVADDGNFFTLLNNVCFHHGHRGFEHIGQLDTAHSESLACAS